MISLTRISIETGVVFVKTRQGEIYVGNRNDDISVTIYLKMHFSKCIFCIAWVK